MSYPQFIYRKMAERNLTKGVEAIQKKSLSTETLFSIYLFMSYDTDFVTTPQAQLWYLGCYKACVTKSNPDRSTYRGYRC